MSKETKVQIFTGSYYLVPYATMGSSACVILNPSAYYHEDHSYWMTNMFSDDNSAGIYFQSPFTQKYLSLSKDPVSLDLPVYSEDKYLFNVKKLSDIAKKSPEYYLICAEKTHHMNNVNMKINTPVKEILLLCANPPKITINIRTCSFTNEMTANNLWEIKTYSDKK